MWEIFANELSLSLEGVSLSRDCVIRTDDGGEFRAHRGFLCSSSPVFQALFSVNNGGRRDIRLHDVSSPTMAALLAYCYSSKALFSVNNGGRRDIRLQGVSSPTMAALLAYCYSSKLSLSADNVTDVLAAADMLLMDEARNQCLHYLLRHMTIENCLGMATLAQWYHCPDFARAVFNYVREHFDQVWRTSDEFPDVPEELLVELLTSNELNVRDETDLLHAIARWSSARNDTADEACADLSRLLQSVRVGLCSAAALEDFGRSHPTLACSRAYKEAVLKAQQRGPCLCAPNPRLLVQLATRRSSHAQATAPSVEGHGDGNNVAATAAPRRPASLPQRQCESCGAARNPERWLPRMPYQMLFVMGGWSEGQERDTIETYDPRAGRWLMNQMQGFKPRAYHGVALLRNRLYVVGGMRGASYLRFCDCFDIESCTWQSCSSMNIARGYVSTVAMEDLRVRRRRPQRERTASVERYSPRFNQWTLVCAMRKRRSDGAACAFKGRIYVTGGFNGQKVLTSVEVYTPSHDTWCLVKQLPNPRCSHQMAVLGGRIYVFGGYDGRRRLSSVVCSGDEEEPLVWRHVSPMRVARSTFAAALFDGELYVIGGFDGMGITAEVECYNPSSDSWRPMVPLNEAVSAMAACTVRGLNVCRRFSASAER
nr:kelch-like protein 18 [Rhipicephalus microplus]